MKKDYKLVGREGCAFMLTRTLHYSPADFPHLFKEIVENDLIQNGLSKHWLANKIGINYETLVRFINRKTFGHMLTYIYILKVLGYKIEIKGTSTVIKK